MINQQKFNVNIKVSKYQQVSTKLSVLGGGNNSIVIP
jgi:hypothetical protein